MDRDSCLVVVVGAEKYSVKLVDLGEKLLLYVLYKKKLVCAVNMSRIVKEKSGRMFRRKVKSVFLTSELSFRSEKSLPRVVFGAMFRERGSLPWVLLWRTDKNKGGEI